MEQDRDYVLLDVTIKDKTKFLQYAEGHRPSMQQYGGKLLFRSNDMEVIEGHWSPKLFSYRNGRAWNRFVPGTERRSTCPGKNWGKRR